MKESLNLYKYENEYHKQGYKLIAGCDEAGRGPLAGPVFCASVILNPDVVIDGLNDSKQLSESKRNKLYIEIKEKALAFSIVKIDEETIDRINILESSRLATKSFEITK